MVVPVQKNFSGFNYQPDRVIPAKNLVLLPVRISWHNELAPGGNYSTHVPFKSMDRRASARQNLVQVTGPRTSGPHDGEKARGHYKAVITNRNSLSETVWLAGTTAPV